MNLSELLPKKCGIYKLYNIKTNRVYIGQSVDIESRFHQHVRDFLLGNHINKKMLADFQEFGLTSFETKILEECEKEILYERETYWASLEQEEELYNNIKSLRGYEKMKT